MKCYSISRYLDDLRNINNDYFETVDKNSVNSVKQSDI